MKENDTQDDDMCLLCGNIVKPGTVLNNSSSILTVLEHFRHKQQEYFVALTLDSCNRLVARRVITIGLLNVALAHPREVYVGAIKDRAASIIIAHNHPSGDARPSKEDIKTTQQLVAAGQLLGIPLRDHVIVAGKDYYSFKQHLLI